MKADDRTGDLLPVLAFDPEQKLFFCADQTLAFGFICQPLTGGDEKTESRLRVLLEEEWPANTMMSFCLAASPNIKGFTYSVESLCSTGSKPILRQAVRDRLAFLEEGTDEAMAQTATFVRNFQLIITVKVPIDGVRQPNQQDMEDIGTLQRRADQCLRDVGLGPIALDPQRYATALAPFLNRGSNAPWRRRGAAPVDHQRLIREQLFDEDVDLRHDKDGLWLDTTRIRCLSVKTFPQAASFGQMIYLIGDIMSGSRGLRFPFLLTTNLIFPDQQKTRTGLSAKRQWTTNMAYGPMLKWVPQLGVRRHDYEVLFASLEDGHKLVRIATSLAVYGETEAEADARAMNAINYWSEQNFTLMPDRFISLPVFLNMMPFGADRQVIVDLGRYRTMTTEQVTNLLPLFADWKGASTPRATLLSRNGQVMGVDLFKSGTNYNAVIAAQSGSGKSFFANDLIYAYLASGAQVWVIDIGRSYQKIADVLGGEFMEFDKSSNIGLNPFALVEDYEDEADMLEGLVAAMAAPNERLSDLQKSAVSQALGEAFAAHGRNTTIDHLIAILIQNPDQRIRDVGQQLYAFSTQGSYGSYFSGGNTVSFNNDLTVLELEHLRNRRHLQKVVLLQLIYQIQQAMYLGDRSRPKLVIIDEAWDLLTDGDVGKFIEHGYRRFRKYNGSAVTITQSIGDLYGSHVGQAVVENSANMFLLGQKPETINSLASSGRLPLSPFGIAQLRTVHT
ncbi:MAG: type IV secretion system protein TraC, partial [Geminicoccaceae bacterium]